MPSKKPDLDALIEAMILGDRTAEYPITQLGAKAVPALVRAMDDPRACQETREPPAILRIWDLLIFRMTPEIVDRMAPFADHENPAIRRNLYGKLIGHGSSVCAQALVGAWRTHADDDRKSIYLSVWRQASSFRDRWDPEFITALYNVIAERLCTGELGAFSHVAETLLKLDPARAYTFLTSHEVFRIEYPDFLGVLMALNSAGCTVPSSAIIPMMPALLAWSDNADPAGRRGYPYEVALMLLARSDAKAARPLVEQAIRSENEFRRESAGEALAIIDDVDDALSIVQAAVADLAAECAEDELDFDLLDDAHANYYLAHEADEMIRNEGFTGYLMETPDANIARTPEALKAIGARSAAESVRQARALVKKIKPRKGDGSLYHALRSPEVAARIEELHRPFLEPEPGQDIPTLLRRYTVNNPSEFRRVKKPRKRR
jgi:hypothetical protein